MAATVATCHERSTSLVPNGRGRYWTKAQYQDAEMPARSVVSTMRAQSDDRRRDRASMTPERAWLPKLSLLFRRADQPMVGRDLEKREHRQPASQLSVSMRVT